MPLIRSQQRHFYPGLSVPKASVIRSFQDLVDEYDDYMSEGRIISSKELALRLGVSSSKVPSILKYLQIGDYEMAFSVRSGIPTKHMLQEIIDSHTTHAYELLVSPEYMQDKFSVDFDTAEQMVNKLKHFDLDGAIKLAEQFHKVDAFRLAFSHKFIRRYGEEQVEKKCLGNIQNNKSMYGLFDDYTVQAHQMGMSKKHLRPLINRGVLPITALELWRFHRTFEMQNASPTDCDVMLAFNVTRLVARKILRALAGKQWTDRGRVRQIYAHSRSPDYLPPDIPPTAEQLKLFVESFNAAGMTIERGELSSEYFVPHVNEDKVLELAIAGDYQQAADMVLHEPKFDNNLSSSKSKSDDSKPVASKSASFDSLARFALLEGWRRGNKAASQGIPLTSAVPLSDGDIIITAQDLAYQAALLKEHRARTFLSVNATMAPDIPRRQKGRASSIGSSNLDQMSAIESTIINGDVRSGIGDDPTGMDNKYPIDTRQQLNEEEMRKLLVEKAEINAAKRQRLGRQNQEVDFFKYFARKCKELILRLRNEDFVPVSAPEEHKLNAENMALRHSAVTVDQMLDLLNYNEHLDLKVYDVRSLGLLNDYVVIGSTSSSERLHSLVNGLIVVLNEMGKLDANQTRFSTVAGPQHGDWIFIDTGSIRLDLYLHHSRAMWNADAAFKGYQMQASDWQKQLSPVKIQLMHVHLRENSKISIDDEIQDV